MASPRTFTRSRTGCVVLAALAIPMLALTTGGIANASTTGPAESGSAVVQHAVSFTVQNVNRSKVACKADGKTYQVRGHVTGTAQSLADPQAVTLLLHGLSYGEFFGDYTAQDGYNFADWQAESGHVTVTIDRLGYGASDKPIGQDICFGSRADIAHQMVQELRSGRYTTRGSAKSFVRFLTCGFVSGHAGRLR